jgi:hypothetical protein
VVFLFLVGWDVVVVVVVVVVASVAPVVDGDGEEACKEEVDIVFVVFVRIKW